MVKVKVYAYTTEDGHKCEDFVIESRNALYLLDACDDEEEREYAAYLAAKDILFPVPLKGNMWENAVLIGTYYFEEKE